MSPFMIFATVLTVVYIIYFAGMISYDLYGKKPTEKETTETFDVSSLSEEESPTNVEEEEVELPATHIEKEVTDDGIEIYGAHDEKTSGEDRPSATENLDSVSLNELYTQGTEEIVPERNFACSSDEFMDMINQKYHPTTQRNIEKENVRDNL